jgi:hypothetical protein
MKRSGKFYRKNEEEVMRSLGLEPTPNSGSGWLIKEDGQNDFVICQLKSTDAQSIKVNQKDIRILEKNASIEHKYPVFAIQFLNTGEIWLMARPQDFMSVSEYIKTGETTSPAILFDSEVEDTTIKVKTKIKSSSSSREMFHKEKAKKFDKTKSAR